MEFLDVRRLTGPNLLWDNPGSILDVRCDRDEAKALVPVWQSYVRKMLDSVGWEKQSITHHLLSSGVSLAFSAPIDVLYAASAINEWAWACCEREFQVGELGDSQLGDSASPGFDEQMIEIKKLIVEESNPALLKLEQAARTHEVPFLWDDDEVTLGFGKHSQTWPFRELPDPWSLDWIRYQGIPLGIVTGTNGKTTTARLAHHILECAGKNVGISSTEWIAVNDKIIDRGDWSGPGGARQVLRQKDVDTAILETARGGLLRRGLGVNTANVALITNISEDHLGDFGSQTLEELLNIKWMLSRTVESQGALVLNADDPMLIEKSKGFSGTLIWFSLHAENPMVLRHIAEGGIGYLLVDEMLVRACGANQKIICASQEIPITMGGAARHNIVNSLAAAALTEQLGASIEEVRNGLISMSQDNNPGRSNIYSVNGVNVLVDFAHNPAAMKAVFDMARALPARRRLLSFGQAGDRPDDLIREMVQCAWQIGLDAVNVSELAAYHRGRTHGEVYAVIRDELLMCGAREEQITHFDEELDSLQSALDWSESGDLIIMLALGGSAPIRKKLQS